MAGSLPKSHTTRSRRSYLASCSAWSRASSITITRRPPRSTGCGGQIRLSVVNNRRVHALLDGVGGATLSLAQFAQCIFELRRTLASWEAQWEAIMRRLCLKLSHWRHWIASIQSSSTCRRAVMAVLPKPGPATNTGQDELFGLLPPCAEVMENPRAVDHVLVIAVYIGAKIRNE